MFISPAEPADFKILGISSLITEQHGVDFLWLAGADDATGQPKWVGVQRKAIPDLLASVSDGRLQREVAQMQGLTVAAVVIEGTPKFAGSAPDAELIAGGGYDSGFGQKWTRAQLWGLLWSIRAKGIWVDYSKDHRDTINWLRMFEAWSKKDHKSLEIRPGPVSVWGKANQRDWQIHVLQGFEGIGPAGAKAIVDAFGGVPLAWTVTEKQLMGVSGLGKKKVKVLMDALVHVVPMEVPA